MENIRKFDFTHPIYRSEIESFRGSDLYRQELAVEALRRSPAVYDSDIEIFLKNNTVCMTGSVPNEEVREAAENVVLAHLGGLSLVNELSVRPLRSYF